MQPNYDDEVKVAHRIDDEIVLKHSAKEPDKMNKFGMPPSPTNSIHTYITTMSGTLNPMTGPLIASSHLMT